MKIRDLVHNVLTEEVKNKKQFSFLLKKWYGDNPTPEQIKKTEDNLTLFFEKQQGFTLKNAGVYSFLLRWNAKYGKGVLTPKLDDQGVPMYDQNRRIITTLVPFKIEDIKDPGRFTLVQFEDFIGEFKEEDLAPEEDEFQGRLVATDKKIEASKKLWLSNKDAVVNEEGFKVKFIPNARVSVKYGFYQQALIQKLLGGTNGYYKQWCVTGRNSDDSRGNLWGTYRRPTISTSRIPRRTFWFIYDESKSPEVTENKDLQKYHLSALQYCVDDYGYTGFKLTSLYNDGDDQFTWNRIASIYPQLAEMEAEFARYEEFEEEELLDNNQLSRISESEGAEDDFAAQPRGVKKAYLERGGTLKSERSWTSMDANLRILYIISSTPNNAIDKFQSEELIRAIKKVGSELKLLDNHLKSLGARLDQNGRITNQAMADLGMGVIYKKIIDRNYATIRTSIDRESIQLIESRKNKHNGQELCGLYNFAIDEYVTNDGIKYSPEYYEEDNIVFKDDAGKRYLVVVYNHMNSVQEDEKTLYTIKNTANDVENIGDADDESVDKEYVHFIGANQFKALKQKIRPKEDDDDEDYEKLSDFDPETDVDIKEMY